MDDGTSQEEVENVSDLYLRGKGRESKNILGMGDKRRRRKGK